MMTLGAYHPYTIHTMYNLGLAYQAASESDKAFTMYQQAAKGLEKLAFTHAEAGRIVEPSATGWKSGINSIARTPGGKSGWRRPRRVMGLTRSSMPES